ncbi:MAG: slipin family protein [Bacteroidetes bacterium]|nr:slipin family protein [Bacteroidota bacterium]
MRKLNIIPTLSFFILISPGIWYSAVNSDEISSKIIFLIILISVVIAILFSASIKIADQWDRAVVLRLGKYIGLRGPGLFFIIPIVESVAYWVDLRVITTSFSAEKTLTKDTVPVDVEAVLFWKVIDPVKASLEVEDYRQAISWASQTALREVIGKSLLSDMLEGRQKIDNELQGIIDHRTEQWGINVFSVEIKDVLIPDGLQNAMSMQAQAERERQARVILGESEFQIAKSFESAAKTYQNNETALHLRAMNMLYEGLKEKSTFVIVPASVLDTMALGKSSGLSSISENIKTILEELKPKIKKEE